MDASGLHHLIGHQAETITWWQMSIRGIAILVFGLLLVRSGGRRIYGRWSPLDIIMSVIIGSNLSRALTGTVPFVPTVVATTSMVAAYWLVAYAAYYSRFFGWLVKGSADRLVTDGRIDWRLMRRHGITQGDLLEAMHSKGLQELLKDVTAAYLERDGSITVMSGK